MFKKGCVAITALCLASISLPAMASLGGEMPTSLRTTTDGFVAGQRFILTQEHAFYVIQNNVPPTDQPHAAKAGEWVTLPAGASIDVINNSQTEPQFGSVVNIAPFDVGNDEVVPSDFIVSTMDLRTANTEIVIPNVLDAQIEDEAQGLSEEQALALDQSETQNEYYFLQQARRGGGGGGRRGHGGGRRGGMTYCLMNVEIKAHQMGICPYKISEGYARRSLPGFAEKCNMERVSYSDSLPIGSICASEGTGHHMCDGARCGDVKMKIGANTWYNGVGGNSSEHAIGYTIGCVAPRGGVRQASAKDNNDEGGKQRSRSRKGSKKSSRGHAHAHRHHRR